MGNFVLENSPRRGTVSHSGRDMVIYSIDLPKISADGFPNDLFAETADNYIRYLKNFTEQHLVPAYEKLCEEGARSRDIKRSLKIPRSAKLIWRAYTLSERFLSLCCETKLSFSDSESTFTLKTLTFDLENMTLMKASDFSKRILRKKRNFYIKDDKLYVFEKNRVFAVSEDEAKRKMGLRFRKIHNKRLLNLCKATKIR